MNDEKFEPHCVDEREYTINKVDLTTSDYAVFRTSTPR